MHVILKPIKANDKRNCFIIAIISAILLQLFVLKNLARKRKLVLRSLYRVYWKIRYVNSSGIVLIRLVFQFQNIMFCFLISPRKQTSQRTTKLTIRRVISEDSDQTARMRRLIRVFADRTCPLQPPGYPKMDKRERLLYWVDVQAHLSLLVTWVLL